MGLCTYPRALCIVVRHVLPSTQIRGSYAQWYCTPWRLHQSGEAMQSVTARLGICTNQRILCTVIMDALTSAPIKVELYTTIFHVLAFVPIRGQYAQWICMSWRLYQLVGCMHSSPERLGVCTNQGAIELCCCRCGVSTNQGAV